MNDQQTEAATVVHPPPALSRGQQVPPATMQRQEVVRSERGPTPKLNTALALAQSRCKAAAKDATNTHHQYKYASAEGIFAASHDAMEGTGLSLLAYPPQLRPMGAGTGLLVRLVELRHDSGESVDLGNIEWPVIPGTGRPLDKAYAAAITTSLAYFYRDLLRMPRVEQGDDLAGHEDRPDSDKPTNLIDQWKRWLDDAGDDIGEVNRGFPALKEAPKKDREPIWKLVLAHAVLNGWEFDKTARAFKPKVEPAKKPAPGPSKPKVEPTRSPWLNDTEVKVLQVSCETHGVSWGHLREWSGVSIHDWPHKIPRELFGKLLEHVTMEGESKAQRPVHAPGAAEPAPPTERELDQEQMDRIDYLFNVLYSGNPDQYAKDYPNVGGVDELTWQAAEDLIASMETRATKAAVKFDVRAA